MPNTAKFWCSTSVARWQGTTGIACAPRRALEVLRCAEAAAGQLGGQLAELGALLAKAAEVKQEEPPSQAAADQA